MTRGDTPDTTLMNKKIEDIRSEYPIKKSYLLKGKDDEIRLDDFNILKVASEDAKMILNNESKYQEYLTHIRQIIHSNEQFVDW